MNYPQQYEDFSPDHHFAFQGKIYQIGGMDPLGMSSHVEVFSPKPKQGQTIPGWESEPYMTSPRINFATDVYMNRIYVMGGQSLSNEVLPTTEYYDIVKKEWHVCRNMLHPRKNFGAATISGNIYACGGDYLDTSLSSVEVYNLWEDRWTSFSNNMKHPRCRPVVATVDDRLYVVGGYGHHEAQSTGEFLDPRYGWFTMAPPPVPFLHACGAADDGNIYVCGGGVFAKFETRKGTWVTLSPPLKTEYFMQCVPFCGDLIFIGGSKRLETVEAVATTAIYRDKDLNQWAPGAHLPQPISNHALVVAYPDLDYN